MKTLYLIRHAKSDWHAPGGSDHERPLSPRGVRAARLMGHFLKAAGQEPDAVLTSSALRARTTVEHMAEAGDWQCPVHMTRQFYESRPDSILLEVHAQPDEHQSLLLAGHEPTWSGMVARLTGARVRMVTAALARIDFEVDRWADLQWDRGTLVYFVPPKLLGATGWAPG